jgi:lysozyme family protein
MSKREQMIEALLGREGGYVNHPHDRGGETIWGITAATARANGYSASMKGMTREQAKSIYRSEFWHRPGLNQVEPIYPRVADELFDTGVNMGPKVAGQFLQRCLNVFGTLPLVMDGDIGPATLRALGAYKRMRGDAGEEVLVRALDALQGERYITLVERRGQNASFVYGWFVHRIENA